MNEMPISSLDYSTSNHLKELLQHRFLLESQYPKKESSFSLQEDDLFFSLLIEALTIYESPEDFNPLTFDKFPLSHLTLYIEKTHYYFLEEKLPELQKKLFNLIQSKVLPEDLSFEIFAYFKHFKQSLKKHIELEDQTIIELLYDINYGVTTIDISLMEAYETQHGSEEIQSLFALKDCIDKAKINYSVGLEYQSFYLMLVSFIRDLHSHHIMEEKVVVPRLKSLYS